jgi:hypothetical protein
MYIAYLIVTALAAAANFFSAGCDFVRYKQVSIAMARAGVPDSWMTTLGIGIPPIGMAAAIGLTLFFVGAIVTHLRAHDYTFGLATVFLALAVAALALGLYARGSISQVLMAR